MTIATAAAEEFFRPPTGDASMVWISRIVRMVQHENAELKMGKNNLKRVAAQSPSPETYSLSSGSEDYRLEFKIRVQGPLEEDSFVTASFDLKTS